MVDAAFVVLLCLANIDSIAAIASIFINYARQAVRWHPILESEPRPNGILAFVYEP